MLCISVIIPVHNAAPWLGACLRSVLGQTLRDIEVICVDDGSTDGSAEIAEEYVAQDPRVSVLRQSENLGQGVARNRGLEAAKGEYIYFMDADDELASVNALERLVGEADHERLDALFFDANTLADPGVELSNTAVNPKDYMRTGSYSGVFDGPALFSLFLKKNEYCASPCLVLFRRGFLDVCGIRFPEARIFYEDNVFMTRVMLAAERMSHRPWRLYIRKVHAGSTVTATPTPRHLEGYRACYEDVCGMLARKKWDRRTKLALLERKMVYLRQMHRLGGSVRPLSERLYGLYICLRCRGFAYMVKRAFRLLCHNSPS